MIGVFSISPLKSNCLLERRFTHKDVKLSILYNNTTVGLSEYYNSVIDKEYRNYDVIVLCHHDVSLEYANLTSLYDAIKKFDVVGVAGCREPKILEKNLWHWMASRENLRGIAAHPGPSENLFLTNFGPTPERVTLLDGVFLAFNPTKLYYSKARFDQQFMWHHYDIDFSLTCNKNKLKLGVWPVLIYHESPGLRDINDAGWNKSNEFFRKKWTN